MRNLGGLRRECRWLPRVRPNFRRAKGGGPGSSARKLRRGHANLLGARALRYELNGITAGEVGEGFDLGLILNHGTLPSVYLSESPNRRIADCKRT